MSTFAKRYYFFDRASAEQAYEELLASERILKDRRERLIKSYEVFIKNLAELFWSDRLLELKVEICLKRTAAELVEAGADEAQRELRKRRIHEEDGSEKALESTGNPNEGHYKSSLHAPFQ